MDEEMEICSNCKREIPSVNYVMHSVHCHRNIAVCEVCGEPVPRGELQEHHDSEHRDVTCQCGVVVENSRLAKHKAEQCKLRVVACTFCELELTCTELGDHENYCGSRTEKCEECGEFVMIKYKGLHVDSNHGFIKLEDEPGPPPSWVSPAKTSVTARFTPTVKPAVIRKAPITSALKSNPSATCVSRPLCTPSASLAPKVTNTVRFADQVEVKRSTSSSSLSSAKRENHRPQVNTKQQVQEKDCVAAGQVDEDLDRLLALRLAQEDMEMLSGNQVSAILHGSTELPKARGPALSHLHDNVQQGATSLAHAVEEEEVQLPCEFCDNPIPASKLVLHQTGCRPDLAQLLRHPHFLSKTSPTRHQDTQPITNHHTTPEPPLRRKNIDTTRQSGLSLLHNDLAAAEVPVQQLQLRAKSRTEDVIPCDLCGTCMPATTFIQHQLACEIHHLPGRQNDRPQALVMPLSGRALKVRKPPLPLNYVIPPEILPVMDESRNLLRVRDEDKTAHKQALPSQREPSGSGSRLLADVTTLANSNTAGPEVTRPNNGAVPKRKAGSGSLIAGQVLQEVPRPPTTAVTSTRRRAPPIRPIDYQRNNI